MKLESTHLTQNTHDVTNIPSAPFRPAPADNHYTFPSTTSTLTHTHTKLHSKHVTNNITTQETSKEVPQNNPTNILENKLPPPEQIKNQPITEDIPANQLALYLTNANCLRNKHTELEALLQTYAIKIACITETWWNPDILEAETSIPNYTVIRNDRKKNKEGGGVCFYVHDLVPTLPAPDLNIDGVVTLRIKKHSTDPSIPSHIV